LSRRRFLDGLLRGAGGFGLAAAASSCDPGEYWDYLSLEEDAKTDDRFHESMSGGAKQLDFPFDAPDSFSFLWTTDIHITTGQPNLMDKLGYYADQTGAVLALHSGDCVDDGYDKEYQKWVRLMDHYLPCPMFSAIGNHDLYSDGWDKYKKYIGPSAYRFQYGTCDFIFIDTAAGTLGWDQMNWLEKILERGGPPNRFIFSHYPIYEGGLQTPSSMGNTEERMKLIWMMDEYNVKYFLCGHKPTDEHYKIRGVRVILGGTASGYKNMVKGDYHFYRFDVSGSYVSKEKIYFDDVELI
jgi:hypothetical protein